MLEDDTHCICILLEKSYPQTIHPESDSISGENVTIKALFLDVQALIRFIRLCQNHVEYFSETSNDNIHDSHWCSPSRCYK